MSLASRLIKSIFANEAGDLTAVNSPGATDNSKRLATTEWAKLGFASLKAAKGYIKLPTWLGGICIQWGTETITVTQTTTQTVTTYLGAANITFATPFSDVPWTIVGSPADHGSLGLESANFTGISATGATSYLGGLATSTPSSTLTMTMRWIAIGQA